MTVGSTVKFRGETWRVIDMDSDPRAAVWLVNLADPDRDAMARREECEVLS